MIFLMEKPGSMIARPFYANTPHASVLLPGKIFPGACGVKSDLAM